MPIKMGPNEMLLFIVMACMAAWDFCAVRMSPYMRNIVSMALSGLALLLFIIAHDLWKLNFAIGIFLAAVYFIAEKYPKNIPAHERKREKITFLQDILFHMGIIMCYFEGYELAMMLEHR